MPIGSQISRPPTPRNLGQSILTDYKSQFNRKRSDKQVFLNKELALDPAIISDPIQFVKSLNRCPLALFNYFIAVSFRCRHLYMTQSHIASKTGMCVRTVQRGIDKFVEHGILIKRYRHNTSCEYRFNPFFYKREVLDLIRSASKGAKFVSIELLSPFSRINHKAPLKKDDSSGSVTGCRTTTLNRFLLNVRYGRSSHINNTPRARERDAVGRPMARIEIEETLMHQENSESAKKNPFNKVVSRIGLLLNLTTAGKVDMTRYPDEAMLYAEKFYGVSGHKAEDKLRWFHYMCKKYCNDRKLKIDHHYASKLMEHFGLTDFHDKVERRPKSNADERNQSAQYSETVRAHTNHPGESSSLSSHTKTYVSKERGNDDYLDSSLEMPTGYREQSFTQQQGMDVRKHSDNTEYSAVTGTHYTPRPPRKSPVREQPPGWKVATAQEAIDALRAEKCDDPNFIMFRDILIKGLSQKGDDEQIRKNALGLITNQRSYKT